MSSGHVFANNESGTTCAATNDGVWQVWSNCTTSVTSDKVWPVWCYGSTTTGTDATWASWTVNASTATSSTTYVSHGRAETKKEKADRIRREEEYQKKVEEERKQREKAEQVAEQLFRDLVDEEAYALFKKHGYHEVFGASGTRYRLSTGRRIDVMEGNFGDKVKHRLCVHSTYEYKLPQMDTLIQQLLMLKCGSDGEEMLTKTANRHAA